MICFLNGTQITIHTKTKSTNQMNQEEKDKKIKEITDNVMNVYTQVNKVHNCLIAQRINELVQDANKKVKDNRSKKFKINLIKI